MKYTSILFISFSIFVLASCKNGKSRRIFKNAPAVVKQQIPTPEQEPEIPARDYTINIENSYNDLFLDSLKFELFITENVTADSVVENMRDFYNIRNFQFAWFDSKGLNEQALGFRTLYKYQTDSVNKQLDKKLDDLLLHETTIDPKDPSILKIEFQLTKRYVEYSLAVYAESDLYHRHYETFVPIRKMPVMVIADSILSEKNKSDEKYAELNRFYHALKQQLQKYVPIQQKGGWDSIPETKTKYQIGQEYPEISAYKKHLSITGELELNDSTLVFTQELSNAIKKYQSANGISPDGKIGRSLIQSLNVPILKRIEQIIINMERMRWMPTDIMGRLIYVNIPDFMLHVAEDNKHVFHMPVVVGKEGHNTTMFSDDLTTIVFSPYWNVPTSIVKKEIMPAMQHIPNYLSKNHMEIVSNGGGIPVIRQVPGPHNSLGRVKFLFPNSFSIYFHDTPSKSLFERDKRAFSHGCIRLSDPVKMANYLLENAPEWTPQKIEDAMNSGKEKWVVLKHKVPVIITYYTAWVDENQLMNFRDDVYGNDAVFASKLFSISKD